ncbi:MAG: WG repeat-containing protein [Prevotellaceae bacterium]|jgi:hypothetical protein|nr:WG repeat-containing protein [Prevotellaceae bacterium]
MKQIFIFMLAAICISAAAFGQNKKTVAVYVTGNCDEVVRKVVSSRIIAQIVRSKEYAAVERTADFLAELRGEQYYQYSGKVDDGQIIKLGKQFGASLVCVADASETSFDGGIDYQKVYEYIFTTRLINIETGLIISLSSMSVVKCPNENDERSIGKDCKEHMIKYEYHDSFYTLYRYHDKRYISNNDDRSDNGRRINQETVVTITDNLTAELLQNVTTTAGKRKLAVYVTKSSGVFQGKTVSLRLIQNFTNSGIYAAVDRTSDFQKEIGYQYTGKVDDRQLTRLGRQLGINLVCVVDVLSTDYTDVRMVNVETGIIVATSQASSWRIDNIDAITTELLSQTVECVKKDEKITSPLMKCCEGLTLIDGVCRDLNNIGSNWVINPQFDDAMSFHEDMAAVKQNGKWGFIDKTGKRVIPPQFSLVQSFSEGLAAAKQDGKFGFIDKTGNWIINPKFDNVSGFSEGLAVVEQNRKWGVINKTGKVAFWLKKDIKDFNTHFSEGLLAVGMEKKSILPKRERELNRLLSWGDLRNINEQKKYREFTGETVERWGFLNKKGEWEIEPQFYSVGSSGFNDGLITVTIPVPYKVADKTSGNHYNTYSIDRNGNRIFQIYSDAFGGDLATVNYSSQVSEGLIAVRKNTMWGYKDKTGKWVIQPQFEVAGNFYDSMALVKQDKKYGYIDKEGKWLILPQFNGDVYSFKEGMAVAKQNNKWGFIDKTGKWAILPVFDDAWGFSEGLAKVKYNGKIGFIALRTSGE